MPHWAMVIDLRKCIGCETCRHVCDHLNDGGWRQVMDMVMQDNQKGQNLSITMGCMHCAVPPCLDVCPTGATEHRIDGIVKIDYRRCIGCGSCILACPYKARKITFDHKVPHQKGFAPEHHGRKNQDRIGVCGKCDFCFSLVDEGMKKGLKPGKDFEATPLCVRYCIADAMYFGDLNDTDSEVSRLIRENKTSCLNEELGTEPSVFYILE